MFTRGWVHVDTLLHVLVFALLCKFLPPKYLVGTILGLMCHWKL